MTVEEMAEGIGRAHGVALDGLTRALWAGVAAGHVGDDEAAWLAEAIQARRRVGKCAEAGPAGSGRIFQTTSPAALRRRQRPPERSVAIERRRRLAASGPMPPALAARFTTGELAVLRIIGDEFQARRVCAICLDAIAARAGVSRTLARNAIRQARRLGMVEVRERRRLGAKSLPNLVTVIDRDWLAWMKRGAEMRRAGVPKLGDTGIGGRNPTTTDTEVLREGRVAPSGTGGRGAFEGRMAHQRRLDPKRSQVAGTSS